ncbi:MAG: hypothetical protein MI861_05725, partial [Pirellulales bacterium]|nr:hypothetical protein [Pirellulales bacterium]
MMMKLRIGFACLVVMPWASLNAQTLVSPALQESKPAPPEEHNPIKVLKIYAAAEPDPALRYRFWPAPEKRTEGNPVPLVNRSIMLSLQELNNQASRTEFSDKWNRWSEMSLSELPCDEVREFLTQFGSVPLGELARAENDMRLEYDLKLREMSAPEIIQTLLPEFQEMRYLARLLQLRARLAAAEQRWDDMASDIRLGFRLAEVAGLSTEFLVGRLV